MESRNVVLITFVSNQYDFNVLIFKIKNPTNRLAVAKVLKVFYIQETLMKFPTEAFPGNFRGIPEKFIPIVIYRVASFMEAITSLEVFLTNYITQ